jgi:hypothetical protein
VELPEERLSADFNADSVLELTPDIVGSTWSPSVYNASATMASLPLSPQGKTHPLPKPAGSALFRTPATPDRVPRFPGRTRPRQLSPPSAVRQSHLHPIAFPPTLQGNVFPQASHLVMASCPNPRSLPCCLARSAHSTCVPILGHPPPGTLSSPMPAPKPRSPARLPLLSCPFPLPGSPSLLRLHPTAGTSATSNPIYWQTIHYPTV